jgi:N-acetylmuramoyl-L-alanine amidase
MPMHVVSQGECLSSIAKKYGLSGWLRIYDDSHNSALKLRRPDPNIIHPGDQWYVPDPEQRRESCATDQQHSFVLKGHGTMVELLVEDGAGRPLRKAPYRLKVGDKVYEGVSDRDGRVKHQIESDEASGTLTVFADGGGYSWDLAMGHLDPLDEISGTQGRLKNLGYYEEEITAALDQATADALKLFQSDHELEITGELDDATRAKLAEHHDKE